MPWDPNHTAYPLMGVLQLFLSSLMLYSLLILLHDVVLEAPASSPPIEKKSDTVGEQKDMKKGQGKNTASGTGADWEEGGVEFARQHYWGCPVVTRPASKLTLAAPSHSGPSAEKKGIEDPISEPVGEDWLA